MDRYSSGMLRLAIVLCGVMAAVSLRGPASADPAAVPSAGRIVWHGRENRVDADFQNWSLDRILKAVAAKARWEVYVEPGLERSLSARFSGLTTGEALRRFFGPLNFAVVPTPAGPVRLYVFRTSVATATDSVEAAAEPGVAQRRSGPIPEELVVILKPDADETIEELAERLG